MRIKSWIASLSAALLIAPFFEGSGFAANDAAGFVASIGQRAVRVLDDSQLSPTIRRQDFTGVVDRTFDLPAIARFTLGPYWRLATPLQRRQFLGVLDAYLVDVYWSRLQQYHGERLTVVSERPLSAGTTFVETQLLRPGGQRPVALDWTVVRRGGQYKILDLSIAGVNQALAERSQFSDLIARDGGSLAALITQVRAEAGQLSG